MLHVTYVLQWSEWGFCNPASKWNDLMLVRTGVYDHVHFFISLLYVVQSRHCCGMAAGVMPHMHTPELHGNTCVGCRRVKTHTSVLIVASLYRANAYTVHV